MIDFQPRYVAYARDHGMGPAEMLEHDKRVLPGGCMVAYMHWIGAKWREWYGVIGCEPKAKTEAVHAEFDAWLQRRVGQEHN